MLYLTSASKVVLVDIIDLIENSVSLFEFVDDKRGASSCIKKLVYLAFKLFLLLYSLLFSHRLHWVRRLLVEHHNLLCLLFCLALVSYCRSHSSNFTL